MENHIWPKCSKNTLILTIEKKNSNFLLKKSKDKCKIIICDLKKLQITCSGIRNNSEVPGIGQNNNLVSTVKFHQNTWRILLVYHVSSSIEWWHMWLFFNKKKWTNEKYKYIKIKNLTN
jgi:hypothetical protein